MDRISKKNFPAVRGADQAAARLREAATIPGMAVSFAAAMAAFLASGFKRVDERSHGLRVKQCEACEQRRETRCAVCGCFFAIKAWLPHEDCAIGRWPT